MGSAFGAGAGADMLQDVLRQKYAEIFERQRLAQEQQRMQMQQAIARERMALDQSEFGFRQSRAGVEDQHYAEAAPQRMATARLVTAQAGNAENASGEAQKSREAQAAAAAAGREFQGGQGDLNRSNAVRIAQINGQNTLAAVRARQAGAGQSPQQQNEVADAIQLIDQIGNDPALNTAVGPVDQYLGKARDLTGVNRFEALHNQLVGKLSLAQAGKLKGQGQISDKERALLAAAATALTRGLSESDYKAELGKIRQQFIRMAGQGGSTPALGTTAPVNADPLGLFGGKQ